MVLRREQPGCGYLPHAAEAEVHAERRRCIKIRPHRCLRGLGGDCQPCEELLITARRAADLARRQNLGCQFHGRAELAVLRCPRTCYGGGGFETYTRFDTQPCGLRAGCGHRRTESLGASHRAILTRCCVPACGGIHDSDRASAQFICKVITEERQRRPGRVAAGDGVSPKMCWLAGLGLRIRFAARG